MPSDFYNVLVQLFMATFYHVDRSGNLEVGVVMDLHSPGKFFDNTIARSPEYNQEVLDRLYPDGLSSHGAKFAHSGLISDDPDILNDGWEAMSGVLKKRDLEEDVEFTDYTSPYVVNYEFLFELYRMLDFEDQYSRFQSYFGFEDLRAAREFSLVYRGLDSQIVKVECESFERRDMELVKLKHFGHIFDHGRRYWSGEGSNNPDWEIVMEPPVEVVEIVD